MKDNYLNAKFVYPNTQVEFSVLLTSIYVGRGDH